MKKIFLSMAAAAIILTGCTGLGNTTAGGSALGSLLGNGAGNGLGSTATSALAKSGTNVLGSLLGNLLGTNTVSEKNLVGTWSYKGVDCVFESENVLSKLGGEVAASALENKIDGYVQKIGIKPGVTTFTFNADHTWKATLGGKSLSGQWALDTKNSQLQMTYLAGLGTLTPKVAFNGGTLSLLFESSKLLTLAQGVGSLTGNSAVSSLSSLIKNYNGMYVGLQMTK
ncbi:MAG: DUF4923 family protein [Bacteroidaceae bacterium]|nr:DUF4923 family protein [Bacteroidaceae bacterium]